jgi:hypothetical protein
MQRTALLAKGPIAGSAAELLVIKASTVNSTM